VVAEKLYCRYHTELQPTALAAAVRFRSSRPLAVDPMVATCRRLVDKKRVVSAIRKGYHDVVEFLEKKPLAFHIAE
jgi:hypothetical protein